MGRLHRVTALCVLATAWCSTSCTDPAKDRAIERLGPEEEGVPEGPEHRPGQPCVLCHSPGGPAAKYPFVIGGTIYESNTAEKGASSVKVFFVDTFNANRQTVTNAVGNFYILESEWPDLAFPFKTGVLRGNQPISMQSPVNREGSCNFCHQLPGGNPRESIGPIFAPAGGGAP